MRNEPKCSVVIPAFNSEEYIKDCVCSVQEQTLYDIEVIIVDDCSGDETAYIAQTLCKTDERLHYFRQEKNCGVAAARNRGVLEAKSEWIAFLDSDDMWLPNKLEAQLALAKEQTGTLFYTGAELMRDDGSVIKRLRVPESVEYENLLCANVISTSGVLCRREALLKFPMERDDLHEDFICWLRLLSEYGTAYGINQPLHRVRVRTGSRSNNKLKSAQKTWRTYRYMQVPFGKAVNCFAKYVCHGIKRYWNKSDLL